jgi:hypothetical protein
MTPTLAGRIQTRIFAIVVLGSLWTLFIGWFLAPGGVARGSFYRDLFVVLGVVLVLGFVWEFIYHGLQQFRWEKDWPTFFGFITGINEGVVVWFVASLIVFPALGLGMISPSIFLWHFITTWIVIFLFLNGPMRVVFLRWRFIGGRIV